MEYMECDIDCDHEFDNMHKTEILDLISPVNNSDSYTTNYLTLHNLNFQEAVNNLLLTDFQHNQEEDSVEKTSFTIISWNVDGLDDNHLDIRTNSFVSIIKQNKPDFVFLQELTSYSESVIRTTLVDQYNIHIDSQYNSYYCGILIKKSSKIKLISDLRVVQFKGSTMGRCLLSVIVNVFGIDVKLMTSHLESMKDYSEERKNQLSIAFSDMKVGAPYSIFAGDMNVRDFELRQISGPPIDIVDVCEQVCSTNYKDMATWEPRLNRNIAAHLSRVPGMRFDRMYFYSSAAPRQLQPIQFQLLGKDVLRECDYHTSDHWAICAVFSI